MTRKQSFAIYCKTGCDVRAIALSNVDITRIFSQHWAVVREQLKQIHRVRVKGLPDHRGMYLDREYGLLHSNAMKIAWCAYQKHETDSKKRGKCIITMKGGTGFVRYMRRVGYKAKTGASVEMKLGTSLTGNMAATEAYCMFITRYSDTKEISFDVIS